MTKDTYMLLINEKNNYIEYTLSYDSTKKKDIITGSTIVYNTRDYHKLLYDLPNPYFLSFFSKGLNFALDCNATSMLSLNTYKNDEKFFLATLNILNNKLDPNSIYEMKLIHTSNVLDTKQREITIQNSVILNSDRNTFTNKILIL